MSHSDKTNNYTEFYYHFFRNILLVSMPLLAITALILSSLRSSASNSANDNLSLSIPISCSLSATVVTGEEHTISMVAGTYEDEIGKTTINTTCNDPNGYVVYAIGNTRNSEGSNVLYPSTISDTYSIPTGINTSGDTSQWAMKLTAINSGAYTPTIDNGYTSYSLVPNSWVKVAHKDPGTTDVTKNSAFTTTYAIYLEGSQPAGTYNGQVKYVMLHPSTAPHPTDTIEHAFALAGKSKVQVTDPITGQSGSFYKMQDMTYKPYKYHPWLSPQTESALKAPARRSRSRSCSTWHTCRRWSRRRPGRPYPFQRTDSSRRRRAYSGGVRR